MKKIYKFCITIILILSLTLPFVGCQDFLNDNILNEDTQPPDVNYTGNSVINSEYIDKICRDEFDYSAIYDENYKSAITITVSGYYEEKGLFGPTTKIDLYEIASGFIVDYDGYVISAFSPFEKMQTFNEIKGILFEGSSFSLEFLAYSINCDIALLRFTEEVSFVDENGQNKNGMPGVVEFENSDNLEYGENCAYIATSSDDEDYFSSLSEGIVSKPANTSNDFSHYINGYSGYESKIKTDYLIQTSITSNSGNEGCAMFNSSGAVVGVLTRNAENSTTYISNNGYGMSFCVPSTAVYEFIEACRLDTSKDYSDLAIEISSKTKTTDNYIANSNALSLKMGVIANNFYSSTGLNIIDENEIVYLNYQGEIAKDSSWANYIADNYQNFTVNVHVADSLGKSAGAGSGFLISKDGFIITNLHVVNTAASDENKNANQNVALANNVFCSFENGLKDGKRVAFKAEIVAYDKVQDIAVLKLFNNFKSYDEGNNLIDGFEKICKFANYSNLNVGEKVVAVGNALGYGSSVTDGVVSLVAMRAYEKTYGHEFIQTDCPINSGNSGGALFNTKGLVVGVNSMGAPSYENVSWAIPSKYVTKFLDLVKQNKTSVSVFIVNANLANKITYQ